MQVRVFGWRILGVAAGLVLAACSDMPGTQKAAPVAAPKPAPVPREYDVPSLLGLNVDELAEHLGAPTAPPADYHDPMTLPLQQHGPLNDSMALFRAGKLRIVATFAAKSHQVIDLVVLGVEEERLLQQANLTLDDSKYMLLAVFGAAPAGKFIGFRVVARQLSRAQTPVVGSAKGTKPLTSPPNR